MKRVILNSCLVCALIGLLSSCFYDEVAVFEGLPENVSLKNDVLPILNTDCSITSCHDALSTHEPSLVSENVYTALVSGGYVNTVEPEKSKLYVAITVGGMPEGRAPLSTNETKIILGWITDGAKNN